VEFLRRLNHVIQKFPEILKARRGNNDGVTPATDIFCDFGGSVHADSLLRKNKGFALDLNTYRISEFLRLQALGWP